MSNEVINTLDEIMDRDPLLLSDQDLDAIIAYQRKYRANLEAGGSKPKRATAAAKGAVKIDITAITKALAPATPVSGGIKRRI